MKKKVQKTIALAAGMLCLSNVPSVFAESDADVELLKQQVQELISQNQQLTRRIVTMEKTQIGSAVSELQSAGSSPVPESLLRTRVHQAVQKEMRKQQEEEGREQKINDYVTLFGLIEGEAVFGDDYEGNSSSEFNVATVELGFDAQVSEWAVGHLLAKYEGPDDNLFIDEANIWLGNYEKFPLLMTAGKFYMPFGSFETNMIQDTLTLEIGEINDYGLAVGFISNGFYGAVYGYNGMKETGRNETIKGFGAKTGYGFEDDEMSFDAGISWVNNIADSGGISDYFDESAMDSIKEQINGVGLHVMVGFGAVAFIGEYVQALDEFAEIAYMDHGAEPKAWNTELAYSAQLFDRESVFAIGYQGSSEAVELGLPEARYIAAASMVLLPGTALTLEYCHDKDYGVAEGGTNEEANLFTIQLGYEF